MWTLDRNAPLPLWQPESPAPGTRAAFTTRQGGVSAASFESLNLGKSTDDDARAVEENRRRVLTALDLDPGRLATAGQVHGARVLAVDAPGHTPGFDALMTATPGLPIAVTAADCLPIIFTAPNRVLVAHSGWRGTAAGMPAAVLRALLEAGAPATDLAAAIGPCIRSCCYEVGPEVASRFPASCVTPSAGRWRLDLVLAARLQLLGAGLADSRIHDTLACTACEPALYFSHRRDGAPSGRLWAVAAVTVS